MDRHGSCNFLVTGLVWRCQILCRDCCNSPNSCRMLEHLESYYVSLESAWPQNAASDHFYVSAGVVSLPAHEAF